jgi:hypothetical protein
MSSLKPIGSEKLKGQDKISRILEISKFKENIPNSINEQSRSEYSIDLSDGNNYQIVKEKQGYIIKRAISESTTEYIEPMKNRKYYSSYSQAFKRLNLLASELNRLNENSEGVSLFGEQKKFTLKTPKPKMDQVPDSPPPLPEPQLSPSPTGDMGGMEDLPMPAGDEMGGMEDLPMPSGDEMGGDMGGGDTDLNFDGGDMGGGNEGEGEVTFKTIQKLTGKLTQKIRALTQEEGITSENIKYVINMIISSFDLESLSEEDREDIVSRLEGDYEENMGGDETMGSLDFDDEMPQGDMGQQGDEMPQGEMEESWGTVARIAAPMATSYISSKMRNRNEEEMEEDYGVGAILDSIFSESKVDQVISKYFEYTKKELNENKAKKIEKDISNFSHKITEIDRLSKTKLQKERAEQFVLRNPEYTLVGLTNKKNLVFEHKNSQRKITPNGRIIV